jgi:hypothetical protein
LQELVRVTRVAEDEYAATELADARFIALVGAEGWIAHEKRTAHAPDGPLARAIAKSGEKFTSIDSVNLPPTLRRISNTPARAPPCKSARAWRATQVSPGRSRRQ